mmetsp:Transcript_57924/g.125800  ORF Transcript_57924/g.125800 Transcript_57924/m.125800 type:complete len:332 (-) Transcript_57924:225-1220(-)
MIPMPINPDALVWSFGFGSNMDIASVRSKKGIDVLDFTAGYVEDWYLAFPVGGMDLVEPAYACAYPYTGPGPARRLHGVAFCAMQAEMDKLDAQEGAYRKMIVTVHPYDSDAHQPITAWIYTGRPGRPMGLPSRRYLNVLLKGCREQGLDAEYIDELAKHPVYVSSTETLSKRARCLALDPKKLPSITVAQLKMLHENGSSQQPRECFVSLLGYVLRVPSLAMRSHGGRDISNRMLRHVRGLALDVNDDGGRPPYPRLPSTQGAPTSPESESVDIRYREYDHDKPNVLTCDEFEYICQWLDNYFVAKLDGDVSGVVGFLAEWRQQSEGERS